MKSRNQMSEYLAILDYEIWDVINRFLDMGLVFFNSLVALMLLTAPWYMITADGQYYDCEVKAGTVIAPFESKFCGLYLEETPVDGEEWTQLYGFVWAYFIVAVITTALLGFEIFKNRVRSWDNANTASFALNIGMMVIQALILRTSNKIHKPAGIEDSTARTLIILSLVLTIFRSIMLMAFMYRVVTTAPRGFFGTGSRF